MGRIDLFQMEAAVEELSRASRAVLAVQRELEHLSGTKPGIRKAAQSLETEAQALHRASEVLREILLLYIRTEQRVLDTVNGEYPVIPRTVFGISRFENLQSYESMIPITGRDLAEE